MCSCPSAFISFQTNRRCQIIFVTIILNSTQMHYCIHVGYSLYSKAYKNRKHELMLLRSAAAALLVPFVNPARFARTFGQWANAVLSLQTTASPRHESFPRLFGRSDEIQRRVCKSIASLNIAVPHSGVPVFINKTRCMQHSRQWSPLTVVHSAYTRCWEITVFHSADRQAVIFWVPPFVYSSQVMT